MAGIWLRLDDATYTRVEQMLERVDRAALDMRPAWHKLVGRFSQRARAGFGKRLKPPSPKYARWKARQSYGPTMTMRLTGTLYRALTGPETAELSRTEAIIGVQTRGGRGSWGDLTYIEVANNIRPVWRNLSRRESLEWGEPVIDHLADAISGPSS